MLEGNYEVDAATGCWNWVGPKGPRSYGMIWRSGQAILAHRAAWESRNGLIPPGMVIRHRCDNPKCVNADHLLIGTQQQNVDDREERNRGTAGRGQKITADAARSIRADTRKQREIAASYGISRGVVAKIKAGWIWRSA